MFDAISWADIGHAYARMQALGLLAVKARPGTAAGHILSLGAVLRALRRDRPATAREALQAYAEFKKIDPDALRGAIEAAWADGGRWPKGAEAIIEEVARG